MVLSLGQFCLSHLLGDIWQSLEKFLAVATANISTSIWVLLNIPQCTARPPYTQMSPVLRLRNPAHLAGYPSRRCRWAQVNACLLLPPDTKMLLRIVVLISTVIAMSVPGVLWLCWSPVPPVQIQWFVICICFFIT